MQWTVHRKDAGGETRFAFDLDICFCVAVLTLWHSTIVLYDCGAVHDQKASTAHANRFDGAPNHFSTIYTCAHAWLVGWRYKADIGSSNWWRVKCACFCTPKKDSTTHQHNPRQSAFAQSAYRTFQGRLWVRASKRVVDCINLCMATFCFGQGCKPRRMLSFLCR